MEEFGRELRRIDPTKQYYQLTLTANTAGKITWSAYSHFTDYTDEARRFELRAPSLVKAHVLADHYRRIGEPCVIVNDLRALQVFMRLGGHALIERSIAEGWLSDLLKPAPVARSGPVGFRSLESVPKAEFQHAPLRKQRMRILRRDKFRCRICGESPNENVHIKLIVHHVRMWSRGGLTEDKNLITVCDACHDGLAPHEDGTLFELMPGGSLSDSLKQERDEYREGVKRYRALSKTI